MHKKTRLLISALVIAMLPACSGSPTQVAKKFWNAVNDGDLEKAKSYATRQTAETLTIDTSAGKADVDAEFGAVTVEGDRTIIDTHLVTRMGDFKQEVDLKTVLVQEDGKWRVDVLTTMMSMFGGEMQEMMQGMTDAMGQAVEGMGEAMMEEMRRGFAQFGDFGDFGYANKRNTPPTDMLTGPRDYHVKFGYMRKRSDGTYYVYKETNKIPMRTRGFKWGYTIESKGDPFTTYSIDYSPDGPMTGDGTPRRNREGEVGWESNTNTVTSGVFYQPYENTPGDTPGARKIEIYIQDQLAKTIEFEVGKK